MRVSVENKEALLAQLDEKLQHSVTSDLKKSISHFLQQFYALVPFSELSQQNFDDIYAATHSIWKFLQVYTNNQPKISVFNPDIEQHGWLSSHTVIKIVYENIPFLVDSVRIELNRQNITIHTINNAVLLVERNKQHQLTHLVSLKSLNGNETNQETETKYHKEAIVYIEIDRHSKIESLATIKDHLKAVIMEARLAVDDFLSMKDKVQSLINNLRENPPPLLPEDVNEGYDFMSWLVQDHFTFLGYEEYAISREHGRHYFIHDENSRLGILKNKELPEKSQLIDELPLEVKKFILIPQILTFAKSPEKSRVHRPAYPDFIVVKWFNKEGHVIGESRIIGLYTSPVYRESPRKVPILRRKVAAVMSRSGFFANSHNAKDLAQILEVFPRDELFQISTGELLNTAISITQIQERKQIRLFIRKGSYGNFFSCLVYIPRDIYNTELRIKIQTVLSESLQAVDSEFITFFSESTLARSYFVLKVNPLDNINYDVSHIEKKIIDAAQSWEDELYDELIDTFGEENGSKYNEIFGAAFPVSYRESFSARVAVVDIQHINELTQDNSVNVSFYRAIDEDKVLHVKLFHLNEPLPLYNILPVFDNLGLKVFAEHPFLIEDNKHDVVWVHDFSVNYFLDEDIDLNDMKKLFYEAFINIWFGNTENDSFNRLIISGQLTWRDTMLLRAYAKYNKQLRFGFSLEYIASTLVTHIVITKLLLEYFYISFDCLQTRIERKTEREDKLKRLSNDISSQIDNVEKLNEDQILRRYFDLISATVRTNFFQVDSSGAYKNYLALKFLPKNIQNIPRPKPEYEVFVCSPRVEGVHLRGGKVARGGIRWSDRYEDYRTEILGLVKAQQVKNAIIVPVGAKGGFVAKKLYSEQQNINARDESLVCYQIFIKGLLDITDNLLDDEAITPKAIYPKDDNDTYLVVAADKGTATFSDTANNIAHDYKYWLDDAFASGGSTGYDHKKMGITARGAFVSVQHHFQLIGKDIHSEDFTVIGIGDMSGDVFGNGMLLSKHIQLVAAFNHMHIFIDPNPAVEESYKERERLFKMPTSTWQDYDPNIISKGGGVFSRAVKWIAITDEMKKRFNISSERLSPNELIQALLLAPVDLLWNGGIGTYIKASSESDADVGDKVNDTTRVNAKNLRCRVIGEGGNLGITQLGRIEFSLNQGKCNTDFIDNSGGVDCSDHEVNIKILLNQEVAAGNLTQKQRNLLLQEMTNDVAELVLNNNLHQAQAISLAEAATMNYANEYRRLINRLETEKKLDRELEFIPNDEELLERKAENLGLTRPELAILFAYTKTDLKKLLTDTNIADDKYIAREIETAFPAKIIRQFNSSLYQHKLKKEIVATQITNNMINHIGLIYLSRLISSTGVDYTIISHAYVAVRDLYLVPVLWSQIEELNFTVSGKIQLGMFNHVMRLLHRSIRWVLQEYGVAVNAAQLISKYEKGIKYLCESLADNLCGLPKQKWGNSYQSYIQSGVSELLSRKVSNCGMLYHGLNIIDAAQEINQSIDFTAQLYFSLSECMNLYWFDEKIAQLKTDNHWQALTREAFRDELSKYQKSLVINAVNHSENLSSVNAVCENWSIQNKKSIDQWQHLLTELSSSDEAEFSMYSVALHELSRHVK